MPENTESTPPASQADVLQVLIAAAPDDVTWALRSWISMRCPPELAANLMRSPVLFNSDGAWRVEPLPTEDAAPLPVCADYRMLEAGERIAEGDELLEAGEWVRTSRAGQRCYQGNCYRRKLMQASEVTVPRARTSPAPGAPSVSPSSPGEDE